MSIEACIECRNHIEEISKEEIRKEIQGFLKAPDKFYVVYNTATGFYKFELIKK